MEIRFAQPQDTPGILALLRQVGQVHHLGRPDIFRDKAQKYSASQVLAMMNKPQSPIFVAVEEEKVLGYGFCQVKIYEKDPVITDHADLYIDDLCVDKNCRRMGVGRTIYKEILNYAKMRHCQSVTLNVWCCNPEALKFYESLGMKPQKMGMEVLLEEE